MLPEELLVDANASLSTSKEALRLVGPLIGAALFTAFGGPTVAAIDAVSFVLAAIAVRMLRVPEDAPVREESHFRDEVLAGIRHIRRDPVLLHTLLAIGVSLLLIGFMESAVFAMVDAFGKPATWVGVDGVGARSRRGGRRSGLVDHRQTARRGQHDLREPVLPGRRVGDLRCIAPAQRGVRRRSWCSASRSRSSSSHSSRSCNGVPRTG